MTAEQIFIPTSLRDLEPGIENRILNAFKENRGRDFGGTDAIPILTDSERWFITYINRPTWHNPEYLVVEVRLKRTVQDPSDGLDATLKLHLNQDSRSGFVTMDWDRIGFSAEAKEYARKFVRS